MTIELTEQEAAKLRDCLTQISVTGPLDAIREHVKLCDSILAKLARTDDDKGK